METLLFLSEQEIRELTGSTQRATQFKRLVEMGLHPLRANGGPVMLAREALIRWQLGERPERQSRREPQLRIRTN